MTLKFTSIYNKEDKWYVAFCPELNITTQGESLEEAQKNLQEAIELYLEDAPREEYSKFTETPFLKTLEIAKV